MPRKRRRREPKRPLTEAERRDRACSGKDCFPTEGAALGYREHVLKKHSRNNIGDLSAYKCTFCPNWHLGHPP